MSEQEKDEARRRRAEERDRKINEYVKKIVDGAPPLTPEQRTRIVALLGLGVKKRGQ